MRRDLILLGKKRVCSALLSGCEIGPDGELLWDNGSKNSKPSHATILLTYSIHPQINMKLIFKLRTIDLDRYHVDHSRMRHNLENACGSKAQPIQAYQTLVPHSG